MTAVLLRLLFASFLVAWGTDGIILSIPSSPKKTIAVTPRSHHEKNKNKKTGGLKAEKAEWPSTPPLVFSADLTEALVRMDEVVNQRVQADLNAVLSFLLPRYALQHVIMAGKELRAVFSSPSFSLSLSLWAFLCTTHGYGHTFTCAWSWWRSPCFTTSWCQLMLKWCFGLKGLAFTQGGNQSLFGVY